MQQGKVNWLNRTGGEKLDLNLFENKEKGGSSFIDKFLEELKNALKKFENKNQNNIPENNVLEEYNLYEKKKIFLDNKSWKGNDFAWVTDEKSVCISEHGDGGPYFLSETDLPPNVKVGEVYEKINGEYVYNDEVTKELNSITN